VQEVSVIRKINETNVVMFTIVIYITLLSLFVNQSRKLPEKLWPALWHAFGYFEFVIFILPFFHPWR
jgi:hypothetical protein